MFGEVLDMVKVNLDPSKGEAYLTAIVALGHIAFHLPEQFPVQMKNLVSRKIVKELLMQDRTEARLHFSENRKTCLNLTCVRSFELYICILVTIYIFSDSSSRRRMVGRGRSSSRDSL